ncbi:hypothetical protein LTR15_001770 [Elasticomyces elasticus]|nr:hypothetical protein LTR15_001770 [Elasticomyces elasticus]
MPPFPTDASQYSYHIMTPKAYILELPTEMLVEIADQLKNGSNLLAFRLTCKSLEKASHDTFATKYFAIRTHLFTRYGLQALVDIAKHPSLGRKVQKIEIIVKVLDSANIGPYDDYGDIPWTPSPHYVSTEAQKLAAREYAFGRKEGWADWDAEAEAHLDESRVPATLDEIFAELASFGASVELDINDKMRESSYRAAPPPYGTKHLLTVVGGGVREQDLKDDEIDFAFESVMTALARTGAKCHALTIGDYWEGQLSCSAFEFANASTHSLDLCLANLTKLRLYLGYVLPIATATEQADFEIFGQACVNLEELHLGWKGYEIEPVVRGQDALIAITGAFTSRRISNIWLNVLCADGQGYIAFLEARCQCLKKLTLARPHMPGSQCWSTVLRWILQHAQLEYLKLDTLARKEPYAEMNDDDDKDKFVLEGDVEGVKEQLRVLLPKLRYKRY